MGLKLSLNFAAIYFMKQVLFFIFSMALFFSCSNSTEQSVTAVQIPQQEKEMQDAIAKYPDSLLLRENLVQYYQYNGTNDLALATLNNIIRIDSNDATLWDKKAELHLLEADTASAIKSYETAIVIFPEPQYIMSVGLLYAFTKNDTALVMADALLVGKNARADKEALLIKGIYYSEINEKEKAISFFNQCLQLNYTYMPAYLQKGITLHDIKKYEEALKVFERAVTLQNKFDEGYYWMGRCYEKLNKRTDAIESYQAALLYNPEYIEAQDALAKLK